MRQYEDQKHKRQRRSLSTEQKIGFMEVVKSGVVNHGTCWMVGTVLTMRSCRRISVNKTKEHYHCLLGYDDVQN